MKDTEGYELDNKGKRITLYGYPIKFVDNSLCTSLTSSLPSMFVELDTAIEDIPLSGFVVLPNDYGIRLAGPKDECFYCHQKVGQQHNYECVVIVKMVEYAVVAKVRGVEGIVGTFVREDPYFWDDYLCESHKNESSWCSDNALSSIKWLDTTFAQLAKLEADRLIDDDRCTCQLFTFNVLQVVDYTPRRATDE